MSKLYYARDDKDDLYLQHRKYIKRERKNGKWVYTYPDDKLGVKNFVDTKVTGKAYKQHLSETTKQYISTSNELNSTTQNRLHAEATSKGYSKDDPKVKSLTKKEETLSKKAKELKTEASQVQYDYYTKSVAGVTEAAVNKGKKAVASLLEKLAKKVRG